MSLRCAKCSAEIPEGSAYCNACGAPLGRPAPPPPPESEQTTWEGRPSPKALAHWWLLYILFLAAAVWAGLRFEGFTRPDLRGIFIAAIGLPALGILIETLYLRLATRYRLTTQRLFRERGILSREMSELELIRVDDVQVRQNVLQRLFGVGRVMVISTDATDPRLEILGIADPVAVKERIRELVVKRRSRAIHFESL